MALFKVPYLGFAQLANTPYWSKKPLTIRRAPRWAGGRVENLSAPQARACLYMAMEVAPRLEGISDINERIAIVQEMMGGKSFGGLTPEQRKELRRRKREANINKLSRIIAEKEGTAPARALGFRE